MVMNMVMSSSLGGVATEPPPSRTIPAGEFKAKCLKLMDEVNETGESIVITKRGRPVSLLVPVDKPRRGILGMFPELKGLCDDPEESVLGPEVYEALEAGWDLIDDDPVSGRQV